MKYTNNINSIVIFINWKYLYKQNRTNTNTSLLVEYTKAKR